MTDSVLTAERLHVTELLRLVGSMGPKQETKGLISYPQPLLLQVHPQPSLQSLIS